MIADPEYTLYRTAAKPLSQGLNEWRCHYILWCWIYGNLVEEGRRFR
jgi:hypothetical protein